MYVMYIIQQYKLWKKRDVHNSGLYKQWKNVMYSIQHFINYGNRRRLIYYCSDKTRLRYRDECGALFNDWSL